MNLRERVKNEIDTLPDDAIRSVMDFVLFQKHRDVSAINESLTIEKVKEIVRSIAPKYGLSEVYLFGSRARGDASADSDFDFRIAGGNIRSLFDLAGLYADLEDAFGKRIDVVQTNNMSDSFFNEIKNEEILVYDVK
jgi:predicted nucleotidyltransferase